MLCLIRVLVKYGPKLKNFFYFICLFFYIVLRSNVSAKKKKFLVSRLDISVHIIISIGIMYVVLCNKYVVLSPTRVNK